MSRAGHTQTARIAMAATLAGDQRSFQSSVLADGLACSSTSPYAVTGSIPSG